MSILTKTELKQAKETVERITKLDTGLCSIVNMKQQYETEIKRIYCALQQEEAVKQLQAMDVGIINTDKEGIRIGTLKEAGITTVGQILDMGSNKLQSINGIGTVSAEKIITNANAVKNQTIKNTQVRISPENKSAKTTELVKNLYLVLREQWVFKGAEKLYKEYHKDVSGELEEVQLVKSGLKWLFADKDKKEAASNSARNLEAILSGDYGTEAPNLIKEHQDISRKGILNPWEDFTKNNAAYYALLENIVDYYDMQYKMAQDAMKKSGNIGKQSEGIFGSTGKRLEGKSGSRKIQKTAGKTEPTDDLEAVMPDAEEVAVLQAARAMTGNSSLSVELLQSIESYPLDVTRLKANLRRYQTFGTKYILHQKKVLLGDEMGLGKTMQAIAAFCDLASKGGSHFLVVCPLSVVVNWKREIESQSDLAAIEVYGEGRAMEMTQWSANGGVAITTFETLNKIPVPEAVTLDMMVVDEAHYIKNPEAQRTRSVVAAGKKAENILYMSGTPLENKVKEMQFLISCLQPEIAEQIKGMKQLTQAEEFREAVAPVYLRRVREDVLKELPELIEKEQWGLMNKEEFTAYENALLEGNFMSVRQVSWQLPDVSKSTKAQRLMEIWEDAKEGGRKLIIFSFFKDVLSKVSGMLGEYCVGVIDGSISSENRQQMIDSLKTAKAGSALVCQIQAGGVGLNIQAASVVVFCEPQIKPSLETQAVARAYRMGQSQSVIVHRLLMQDSVDERIMEILHTKGELFDQFADESVIGDMDIQANEGKEGQADSADNNLSSANNSNDNHGRRQKLSEDKMMSSIMKEECKRLGIATEISANTKGTE